MVRAVVGTLRRLATSHPRLTYVLYLSAFALVGGYVLSVVVRSYGEYNHLKGPRLGFRGRLHRADPELGYAALPGASGWHVFPVGPPLPTHYSREGFRIPVDAPEQLSRSRPYVLTLGCSFTYGDACLAEDAYPARLAELLGGTALNAGKCGYGLAHMLTLARRLIPLYRPEYVVAQYSFWLVGRGTSGFERSALGRVPAPYLRLGADGRARLSPPVYRARAFDLPVDRYDNERRGLGDFFGFLWRVGLPLQTHDDVQMARYQMRRWTGALALAPEPPTDRLALERAVYQEIAELCRAHGARMIVLRLGKPYERYWTHPRELQTDALVVDAQSLLEWRLPEGQRTQEEFYRRFAHWRGNPPRLIDTHPNAEAHRITARAIARALKEERQRLRGEVVVADPSAD